MNFEERVGSIVDGRMNEMLDLFQSSTDRTKDLLDLLQKLVDTIPLIQDIKTELAQTQKKINDPKPEDESDDEKEKKNPNTTDDDPHKLEDLRQFLEDLGEKLLAPHDFEKPLLDPPPGLPALPGNSGGQNFRDNWNFWKTIYYVWKSLRDLRGELLDKITDEISRSQVENFSRILSQTQKTVKDLEKIVHREISSVSNQLEECCSGMAEQMAECCQSMTSGLEGVQSTADAIKDVVDQLSPKSDNNKDLALQARARAILAEVQAIRGLL